MGIPRGSARLLIEEAKREPFGGTVLQLGRSSVYFTWPELERWARRHAFELRPVGEPGRSHDPRLAAQGCLDDRTFFAALGFDRVEACDIEPWEGAEHLLDLNGEIPAELENRFDVVFETGTLVQIFDLPKVLENLHRLVAPGGRIIHCAVPSNNHMDLGFYMLSPTFFADFYRANGYRIDTFYLCEYFAYWFAGRLYSDRWRIYEYRPGLLDALSYGRYGGPQAATFVVATKVDGATGDRRPQLGQYRRAWESFRAHGGEAAAAGEREDAGGRSGSRREQALAATPLGRRAGRALKRLLEGLRRALRLRGLPRPVARY